MTKEHSTKNETQESLSEHISHIKRQIQSFIDLQVNLLLVFIWHYKLNVLAGIFLISAVHSYSLIDPRCPMNTEQDCVIKFMIPRATEWMGFELISSCLYVMIFWFAVRRIIHRGFMIAIVFTIICQIFLTDHTISSKEFSGLKLLVNLILIVLVAIAIISAEIVIWVYKKSKLGFILSFIISITFTTIALSNLLDGSCNNWKNGLKGETLDTSDKYCEIREPSICWYDIMHGVMDANKIYDCTKQDKTYQDQTNWLHQLKRFIQIPVNTKYIELPRTEHFNSTVRSMTYNNFQNYFFSQYKFHESLSNLSSGVETYLDLENMRYITQINKNQSIVKQRADQFNQKQEQIKNRRLPKNIVILYVDALSRARLIQKLPKTIKLIENITENKKHSHTTFQAFRYLSVADYTFDNYLAYEYGTLMEKDTNNQFQTYEWTMQDGKKLIKEKPQSNTKTLQDSGYIVAKARGQCVASIMEHEPFFEKYIQIAPPDHEFTGVMCDPNYQDPTNAFGMLKGPYSIMRKCMYGLEINSMIFDYGKQFLTTYQKNPKYLEMQFLDSHEGTGEAINYFDDPLYEFIEWFENQRLEDTMLMVVSDHGLHMQGLYFLLGVDIYKIEIALPSLVIILDNNLLENQNRKQLLANQQKLVTFFELHYFLEFLMTPDGEIQNHYSNNSIISDSIKDDRSCADIPQMGHLRCVCKKQQF